MPIRINLLAEQQATDELRRRDPVNRAIWDAGFVVVLLLIRGAYLQVKMMRTMREVNHYASEWKTIEKEYSLVISNVDRIAEVERRISALQSLATNRFLWAPALNALQYTIVDDVEMVRLKTEQIYAFTEGIKPSTNSVGVVSRGKPPTSREKIVMTIDAKDSSSKPGDQISKFQEKLNSEPYFKTNLKRSELMGRSPVQTDAVNPSRPFMQFTLECEFPQRTR